jgi:glucokinase
LTPPTVAVRRSRGLLLWPQRRKIELNPQRSSSACLQKMILAGDIGGTKCNVAVYDANGDGQLRLVFQNRFPTRAFTAFEQLMDAFFRAASEQNALPSKANITNAGFGVAGTVVEGRLHAINLPWVFDAASAARKLKLRVENVTLMNDLVATAGSLDKLTAQDLLPVNQVALQPAGSKAVIAAGTGLGTAMLFWDGTRYHASASEGGAADFAPRTDREIALLEWLKQRVPRVSCEEVFSGRGFRRVHEFLDASVRHASFDQPGADSAKEIAANATAATCPVCVETVDLWIAAFGSEAGNLALRVLAYGGLYLAGGIAVKILPKLLQGSFARAFADKAPLTDVLSHIPLFVILNEDAPLLGAAHAALSRAHSQLLAN